MYISPLEVVSAALQIYCMMHNHDPYGNCQLRRKNQPIVKIDSYHYVHLQLLLARHSSFYISLCFLHRSISIACALFISTFSANHAFHAFKLMHDSYKYRITTDNIIVRLLNCTSLHSAFHCEKFSSCFWSFEDMVIWRPGQRITEMLPTWFGLDSLARKVISGMPYSISIHHE